MKPFKQQNKLTNCAAYMKPLMRKYTNKRKTASAKFGLLKTYIQITNLLISVYTLFYINSTYIRSWTCYLYTVFNCLRVYFYEMHIVKNNHMYMQKADPFLPVTAALMTQHDCTLVLPHTPTRSMPALSMRSKVSSLPNFMVIFSVAFCLYFLA